MVEVLTENVNRHFEGCCQFYLFSDTNNYNESLLGETGADTSQFDMGDVARASEAREVRTAE